jgi:hypothetical protein
VGGSGLSGKRDPEDRRTGKAKAFPYIPESGARWRAVSFGQQGTGSGTESRPYDDSGRGHTEAAAMGMPPGRDIVATRITRK